MQYHKRHICGSERFRGSIDCMLQSSPSKTHPEWTISHLVWFTITFHLVIIRCTSDYAIPVLVSSYQVLSRLTFSDRWLKLNLPVHKFASPPFTIQAPKRPEKSRGKIEKINTIPPITEQQSRCSNYTTHVKCGGWEAEINLSLSRYTANEFPRVT